MKVTVTETTTNVYRGQKDDIDRLSQNLEEDLTFTELLFLVQNK